MYKRKTNLSGRKQVNSFPGMGEEKDELQMRWVLKIWGGNGNVHYLDMVVVSQLYMVKLIKM